MKKRKYLYLFILFLFPLWSEAQCAMCRAVLESEENGATAEGINNGIVYLMVIPYVVVGVVIFLVYQKMKNRATA